MSTPELQALLANLRPRSQASASNVSKEQSRDPSASFASASQIPSTPPPPFPTTPSQSAHAAPNTAIAQNLLNLLNFNHSTSAGSDHSRDNSSRFIQNRSSAQPSHDQAFSAPDQVATFSTSSGNRSALNLHHPSDHHRLQPLRAGISPIESSTPTPHDTTEQQAEVPQVSAVESFHEGDKPTHEQEKLGAGETIDRQQQLGSQPLVSKPIFTYTNPFEALKASRPHTPRAPQSQAQAVAGQVLAQSAEVSRAAQELNQIMTDRVKLTPKSRTSKPASLLESSSIGVEEYSEMQPSVLQNGTAGGEEPLSASAIQKVEDPLTESEIHGQDTAKASAPATLEPNGEPVLPTEIRVVSVMSFPVKAFVSISLNLQSASEFRVREEGVMEISRLKKEFDQIDRSLAVASSRYITYAFVKNGGMRIIRQDDGTDRQVFKNSHDRVFNVSICTTTMIAPSSEHQAVLGTGVSGAVYYATISKPGRDMFDSNELESESLIFPAYPQADENTAGGVLKTRAKRSSKHPEFFAIGRGKAIHIIWPAMVMSHRYGISNGDRTVDMEKLFQERPLQILTGKAGKDFTFSEDDTMIVSLDKTGRLRFWDIRKLIDEENAKSVQITPYIIDVPTLSLSTASPAERSWPTSVLFVDKARPYTKGGPLRYVLVGLRQNHTLQLWDIALGKAVQEINFPHESETDGICSVTYHPASGIIAVGHPTRNSIFFIHLSAPRYALSSSLSQASYVQRVAIKDPDIPKPESTACMSGIREISFEGRGQIRSVELLPVYKPSESTALSNESEALFELYIVHSKGVICLPINKEDLGWNSENKIIHSIDAEKEGIVVLKELKLGSIIEESARSKSPVLEPVSQPKISRKKSKKPKDPTEEPVASQEVVQDPVLNATDAVSQLASAEPAAVEPTPVKETKKSKKKNIQSENVAAKQDSTKAQSPDKPETALLSTDEVSTKAVSKHGPASTSQAEQLSMSISGDWLDKELKKVEKGVGSEFKKELEQLYQNIKTDRASQDQASASRQEAVLRVVSTTLNTNVEKSLARILATQMQEVVVPSVVETVSARLSERIIQSVSETVPRELAAILPDQLDRTLQSPQMLLGIADNVTQRLAGQIEGEIIKTINTTVASSMKSIATTAAHEVFAGAEARIIEQTRQVQLHHNTHVEKINQMSQHLQSVMQILQNMSNAQAEFQRQVLQEIRLTQAQSQNPTPVHMPLEARSQGHGSPPSAHDRSALMFPASPATKVQPRPVRPRSQSEVELDEVTALMENQQYEEGSIKWLQSSKPNQLFDELFVRYTPDYLATDVSPLVAFTIGVTVASELATNTQRRLEWITAAFDTLDFKVSQNGETIY